MPSPEWRDVGGRMNLHPARLTGLIAAIWLANFVRTENMASCWACPLISSIGDSSRFQSLSLSAHCHRKHVRTSESRDMASQHLSGGFSHRTAAVCSRIGRCGPQDPVCHRLGPIPHKPVVECSVSYLRVAHRHSSCSGLGRWRNDWSKCGLPWRGIHQGVVTGLTLRSGSITLTDAVGLRRRAYFQTANYVIYGAGSA